MMEKNVEPDGGGNNAGGGHATGPNHHTQADAFTHQEWNTEQGEKASLSGSQHAFSPYAFPCANHAAHKHINAKAPSREPDRHEDRYRRARTRGHQDDSHYGKH